MRKRYSILVVVALFSGSASAGVLWDNGIVPNGVGGRAISGPSFPDIRVADDVTFLGSVQINDFHANVAEDAGWTDGGMLTLNVYADTGNGPGDLVDSRTGEFTKMDTGDDYFGRDDYDYWLEGIDIALGAGTYWVGIRNDNGGGAGTNYWMYSDGGRDGPGTSGYYVSLNAGDTWEPTNRGQIAFVVTGVPEPSTSLLLGIGGLVLLRRRR